mmetsp:Transcript_11692/g.34803  ORF Transcript_11692/g.34803 Transcript_11692/m.34803 type:complete len:215 (-) Transcript_11692:892-1536(-)
MAHSRPHCTNLAAPRGATLRKHARTTAIAATRTAAGAAAKNAAPRAADRADGVARGRHAPPQPGLWPRDGHVDAAALGAVREDRVRARPAIRGRRLGDGRRRAAPAPRPRARHRGELPRGARGLEGRHGPGRLDAARRARARRALRRRLRARARRALPVHPGIPGRYGLAQGGSHEHHRVPPRGAQGAAARGRVVRDAGRRIGIVRMLRCGTSL